MGLLPDLGRLTENDAARLGRRPIRLGHHGREAMKSTRAHRTTLRMRCVAWLVGLRFPAQRCGWGQWVAGRAAFSRTTLRMGWVGGWSGCVFPHNAAMMCVGGWLKGSSDGL